MKRRLLAVPLAFFSLVLLVGTAPVAQAAAKKPSKVSSVRAVPGSRVGEITLSWKSKGKNTKSFVIETALTNFNPSKSSPLPAHGLNAQRWAVSARTRSLTLTASKLTSLGASLASGNHLYIRVTPYNGSRAGTGKTVSMFPRAQSPVGSGSWVRMASYNVRSAPSTFGTSRSWPNRGNTVARTIISANPGIAVLQELSPGPVTGKSGTPRQTEDLVTRLHALGGTKYEMVRTSPYVKAGTTMGTQGARILFDTTQYNLLSDCPETTGKSTYNSSCSVILTGLPGESLSKARPAAIAEFEDQRSGQRFWVASIHLDNRDGVKYENLRAVQMSTALRAIADRNPDNLPVLLGGDFNAWQNNYPYNYAPHNLLIKNGFYDTAAAVTKVNMRYSTMNHFDTTLKPSGSVLGSRLDHILAKGIVGSQKFVNVMSVRDSRRGSDHNMIYSEFRFR